MREWNITVYSDTHLLWNDGFLEEVDFIIRYLGRQGLALQQNISIMTLMPSRLYSVVYRLDFFATDTNTNINNLMIPILNDTDTFTTKCQHIL